MTESCILLTGVLVQKHWQPHKNHMGGSRDLNKMVLLDLWIGYLMKLKGIINRTFQGRKAGPIN